MDDASLELLLRDLKLHLIGGFLGGAMALCVIDANGLKPAAKRLFCSLAAAPFAHVVCRICRYFYSTFPNDRMMTFGVAGVIGFSAYFVLHWPGNYLSQRTDKTLWDIAQEAVKKTAKIKKGRVE